MSVIQVNTSTLRSQAMQLKAYREQHIQTMNRLKSLILTLNDDWKGEAQGAFVTKYQSMQSDFTDFNNMLKEYYNLLKSVADEMEHVDQEMRSLIQKVE